MKKLVIFDVDNTIVKGQSQRLLLSYLFKTKKVSFYYYICVLIWFIAYKLQVARDPRKVISFAYSFLKDKTVDEIELLMNSFFESVLKSNIFPEALVTIKNGQKEGAEVILISNAPSIVIKPLARYLGIETYFCTQLEIIEGKYNGRVEGDIMYGENKKTVVESFVQEKEYELAEATAYGDHISDLPVLGIVQHPIAINPSPALAKIAQEKGWEIHNWNL